MKNHPNRKELIMAAKSGSNEYSEHFKSCDWCRTYFEMLKEFHVAGVLPLVDAPKNWVNKAAAVGDKVSVSRKLKSLVAILTFDSWAMPQPAGVRSEGVMQERRVRFEISGKIFDLRAEHRRNKWDFVARVTDGSGKSVDCTIVTGKKELNSNEDGFYLWSSVRPPSKFKLLTETGELEIPELSWK